ncbi:hypothetical protein J3A83DRAFT_4358163 [Scleroderma citrinum]
MAQFLDIPVELLPIIFSFVLKPHYLTVLCLVNKTFNVFATPVLYGRFVSLFCTLADYPRLAVHVRNLDIRVFPKGLHSSFSHLSLLDLCVRAIKNCVNLKSCTWTRDGSLHATVLESLSSDCPQLEELEINGNSVGYDPVVLTRFQKLQKISLIMPNRSVLDTLPAWMFAAGARLRSLTITCKASAHVTDAFLELLSSYLTDLEHLFIVGCSKVTHRGIGALVAGNRKGLLTLNLEGLSQSFDIGTFKNVCHHTQALRRLRSITLTVHVHTTIIEWTRNVKDLLETAPLEVFQLYSTDELGDFPIPDDFWKGIAATRGSRFKRFSVYRIQMTLAALQSICSRCPRLEQLLVVVDQRDLIAIAPFLAPAENLRTLHINTHGKARGSPMSPSIMMQTVLDIVSHCSLTLTHFGCDTTAWQVQRVVHLDENGEKYTLPTLVPRENPDIPEQFLVVRA